MIYLCQNDREYDYDVRAIALAFFEREKIIELTEEEFQQKLAEISALPVDSDSGTVSETKEWFLHLSFDEAKITGRFSDQNHKESSGTLECDYQDHEKCRNQVCRFLYRLFSDYTGRELPWGMLTGIRPTKIIMKWMEDETDQSLLESRFSETYLADPQKAHLCCQVAAREKEILAKRDYEKEYSLYIGIPFCPTTCLYCSFASFPVARFGDRMWGYMEALFKELSFVSEAYKDKKLTSIYVGGGTPTALDESSLYALMNQIHRLFPVSDVVEFTVEAGRPDSITREKLEIIHDAQVGRISINPQTMHQETLDLIGRNHTVNQIKEAYYMARELGFQNINMDMITGLPGEELKHVYGTLEEIFGMKPDSLTVHSLAIKRAAHLNMEMERYQSMVKGSTNEMLRLVDEYCGKMGMIPYYMYRQKNIPGNLENIGYSLPGKECLYNILIMEEKQDIISCGAGASTKYVYPEENRIERTENVKNLDHYINRIDEMIERKRNVI